MSDKKQPASVTSTEAQTHFGALIRRVYKDGEHLIVERDGLPVVVVLPYADFKALDTTKR